MPKSKLPKTPFEEFLEKLPFNVFMTLKETVGVTQKRITTIKKNPEKATIQELLKLSEITDVPPQTLFYTYKLGLDIGETVILNLKNVAEEKPENN